MTINLTTLPASQNTAPVNEFRCLFTHDVRRKQKRWHDGYLKFHTFNNRIMVYDQSRNFLGDTYWKEANELQEGDELFLDKPVMVEVAEAIGVTQTDLTPLFERIESPRRSTTKVLLNPISKPNLMRTTHLRTTSQLHKSLNSLLGPSRGPSGKAAPPRSPFEARLEKVNFVEEGRAVKKQKMNHSTPITSSPIAENRGMEMKSAIKQAKPLGPLKSGRQVGVDSPKPSNLREGLEKNTNLAHKEFPDLSSSVDMLDSLSAKTPRIIEAPRFAANVRSTHTRPRLPKGGIPITSSTARESPPRRFSPSSPPISTTNRLTNVDFATRLNSSPLDEPALPQPLPRKPKTKSLRLSAGIKKGTLLCQAAPQISGINALKLLQSRSLETKSVSEFRGEHAPRSPSYRDLHKNRKGKDLTKSKIVDSDLDVDQDRRNEEEQHIAHEPNEDIPLARSANAVGDMQRVHGLMDQQLLVSCPSLITPRCATSTPSLCETFNTDELAYSKSPPTLQENIIDKGSRIQLDTPKQQGTLLPIPVKISSSRSRINANKQPANLSESHKRTLLRIGPVEERLRQPAENRSFRRTRSDNDAPIPSMSEQWEDDNLPKTLNGPKLQLVNETQNPTGSIRLSKRTDSKRTFRRTQSLRVETNVVPTVNTSPVTPPADTDVGPWSTEAFDLFDWRPPSMREVARVWGYQ